MNGMSFELHTKITPNYSKCDVLFLGHYRHSRLLLHRTSFTQGSLRGAGGGGTIYTYVHGRGAGATIYTYVHDFMYMFRTIWVFQAVRVPFETCTVRPEAYARTPLLSMLLIITPAN